MAVNHLRVLLLSLLTIKTGFSAEISVFVKTGDSVQLDILTQQPPQFDLFIWRKDKSDNIVLYFSGSKTVKYTDTFFKDRVYFNDKTFSLTLNNTQKTDSGLYTAKINGDKETDIVTYRVSVIDAVEAPVLTIISNWSSSDSCTVNFTCRGHDLIINNSYQNNGCSSGNVTSPEYTLILSSYCEESIICNYSNPVSWKEDKVEIKPLCVNKGNGSGKVTAGMSSSPWLAGVLVAIPILGICFICFIVFRCFKRKKGAREGGTVYDEVQELDQHRKNSDSHTYDTPGRGQVQTKEETEDNRPTTTYCTVGQYQTHEIQAEKDHTIYSVVCKPPKTTR